MTPPLRVGIVGCGNVALNFHVPAYRALPDRYRIVGLADPTPDRLELGRATAGLDAAQVHLDAAALLARDDVDVIDVCTPQHLHRDLVLAAATAGKNVLCEKPIAAVPADAAAMVAAAADAGVVLAVVHNYLFFPEVVALRALVDSGELGEVRTVTVSMLGVVDSPGAAGYRPQWRHDPAAAGGAAALHTLEITVAAYAAAALGRTVAVPLPTASPLHRAGVVGLGDLAGPDAVAADSPVRRRGLFGLGATSPTGA